MTFSNIADKSGFSVKIDHNWKKKKEINFSLKKFKIFWGGNHPATFDGSLYPLPRGYPRFFVLFVCLFACFFIKMTAKDVKEMSEMPVITFFCVFVRPETGGGTTPLVWRGFILCKSHSNYLVLQPWKVDLKHFSHDFIESESQMLLVCVVHNIVWILSFITQYTVCNQVTVLL